MTGKVYLVGAGCGDTGLLTIKALNCIENADVIIYDSLINPHLLSFTQKNCEKIFVGKRAGNHSLPQEQINALLLDKALKNKTVVRLKGGDPFIFGRGGEEALFLEQNRINFEIVCGISSFYSAAAYAGIPITHRGISRSFHVISGHNFKNNSDLETYAKLNGTLVFLMGLNNIKNITDGLINNGKNPDTPAAVILNGTMASQTTIIGTLETISQKYTEEKNNSDPGIIIIGEVVNLREKLSWFEKLPLWGRKIIITRAKHQNKEFTEKIEELGGTALEFPTIEIEPIHDKNIDNMYKNLYLYDWIVFTSVNAVEIFIDSLIKRNKDIRSLGNAKIAAIGKTTAKALEDKLLKVEILPEEFVSENFANKLKSNISSGDKVLIPCSRASRGIISSELLKIGALVETTHIYDTVLPYYDSKNIKKIINQADSVCFTSPSTVINFLEILTKEQLSLPADLKVYCLGSVTKETAAQNGINVYKTAIEYTINGLLEILAQ